MLTRIKRLLVGEPLSNQMAEDECIPKWQALAILSSDALSSVAYATEEILIPLAAFTAVAVSWSMPIAIAIATLMLIVALSYRQTIQAYPQGGGAYTVARENLGLYPGLVAGAALLIDYVLTVAVSVAAGVENIASAFPMLHAHRELLGCLVIVLLTLMNLRGVRESGAIFALPTYFFMFSFFAMMAMGAYNILTGQAVAAAPILHETYPAIPLFLLFRSFSSGCAAMTGIEAISNGVGVFREPKEKNARTTMLWMVFILGTLFIGITLLAHIYGITPQENQTAISLLARAVFGDAPFYYVVQGATALILLLAANTSYTGFPRLSSLLAQDRYLPRQLASLGDRLVFSNGINGLSMAAAGLIILFRGDTHLLIPLYAVGVFLSFTLSQIGMIVFHLRNRRPGWRSSLMMNATGAVATAVVLMVIAISKFAQGAWIVILLIPMLVFVFTRIHKHYLDVGKELSLLGKNPVRLTAAKHTVIVPVSGVHQGVLDALRYAISISSDVRACYVELDSAAAERMTEEWNRWAPMVPFVVLKSPYRSVIRPILEYIDDVESSTNGDMITVLIPEFVTAKWYHNFLHNQTAFMIRTALLWRRGKVVTSVRYHLHAT